MKKYLIAAMVAALALPAAASAETKEILANLSATVPTPSTFEVTAKDGWDKVVQNLVWDDTTGNFDELDKDVNVKSSLGEVEAYLASAVYLKKGFGIGNCKMSPLSASCIGVSVGIDSHTLGVGSANAVVIASASEAAAGKDVTVKFNTAKSTIKGSGTFTGTATLMFESPAP